MKDGKYIINRDRYESIETNWIALYVNAEHITYVDSFGVYIPKEIRKYIGKKNITTNNYRRRANNSINLVRILLYWINWFHITM